MPSLRFVTWNCHHASLVSRLSDVSALKPDVAFIQEWDPRQEPLLTPRSVRRQVIPSKGIAFVSLNPELELEPVDTLVGCGQASIAATVRGPVSLNVLGIWAQAPNYATDVLDTIDAYSDFLNERPTLVMGDFNSGTDLGTKRPLTQSHRQFVDRLAERGLVSAYHAFHRIDHACEQQATYWHQFKQSQPWHIDFCFVPTRWAPQISKVDVQDGPEWQSRSDHRPLVVEVAIPEE